MIFHPLKNPSPYPSPHLGLYLFVMITIFFPMTTQHPPCHELGGWKITVFHGHVENRTGHGGSTQLEGDGTFDDFPSELNLYCWGGWSIATLPERRPAVPVYLSVTKDWLNPIEPLVDNHAAPSHWFDPAGFLTTKSLIYH